jgi:hypothetical protein
MSYCGLQLAKQVSSTSSDTVPLVQPVSSSARLLLSWLYAMMPFTTAKLPTGLRFVVDDLSNISEGSSNTLRIMNPMSNLWHPRELSDHQRANRLIKFVSDIHDWLFYSYGAYFEFPMRIARIRMLCSVNRPQTRLDQAGIVLSRVHFLKLVLQTIAGVTGFFLAMRQKNRTISSITQPLEPDKLICKEPNKVTEAVASFPFNRSCSLCRGRIESPGALPCGHIFCWQCLQSWRNSSRKPNEDAFRCPMCAKVCRANDIRPLFFYLCEQKVAL